MQKRIALLYDFDYTLTDKFMQQYGLMQDLGYTDETVGDFFTACEDAFGDADIDMCLSLMGGILFMAKDKGRKVSKEYLKSFGKDIRFYPGVEEWFDKINEIGRRLGYEIEHYIISSGIAEIIIAKQRGGSTGTVDLLWMGSYTKFVNLEKRYDD